MLSYLTSARGSDEDIINKLTGSSRDKRKGEDELFVTYSYFIKEGMTRYHLGEDDTFNAYSDTIIAAINSISAGQFHGNSSLKTFLYTIFHNKCVDVVRKKTTNKSSVNHTVEIGHLISNLSDTAKSIVEKLTDRSDFDRIRRKVNELGENCRNLLMMFASGYSDNEIAVEMNYKTSDVVKTSRLRCLAKLRSMYALTKE